MLRWLHVAQSLHWVRSLLYVDCRFTHEPQTKRWSLTTVDLNKDNRPSIGIG